MGAVRFRTRCLCQGGVDRLEGSFTSFSLGVGLNLRAFSYSFERGILGGKVGRDDPTIVTRGFSRTGFLFKVGNRATRAVRGSVRLKLGCFRQVYIGVVYSGAAKIRPSGTIVGRFVRGICPMCGSGPEASVLVGGASFKINS